MFTASVSTSIIHRRTNIWLQQWSGYQVSSNIQNIHTLQLLREFLPHYRNCTTHYISRLLSNNDILSDNALRMKSLLRAIKVYAPTFVQDRQDLLSRIKLIEESSGKVIRERCRCRKKKRGQNIGESESSVSGRRRRVNGMCT